MLRGCVYVSWGWRNSALQGFATFGVRIVNWDLVLIVAVLFGFCEVVCSISV